MNSSHAGVSIWELTLSATTVVRKVEDGGEEGGGEMAVGRESAQRLYIWKLVCLRVASSLFVLLKMVFWSKCECAGVRQ